MHELRQQEPTQEEAIMTETLSLTAETKGTKWEMPRKKVEDEREEV